MIRISETVRDEEFPGDVRDVENERTRREYSGWNTREARSIHRIPGGRPLRIGDVELAESAKFIRHGEPDERSATDANKVLYGQRWSPNSPPAHRPTSRNKVRTPRCETLCIEVRTIENGGLDRHSCASLEDRVMRMAGGSA
ncbi:hypothetical protein K0M31_002074 [Melipona bicolor]|uniref:Uncharacterized protein n=1 Tax=Melipona bicolor TaxID=60889 RepID=A0AA40KYA5_9HYME|nr:hypothetical protein K0M31_002074 [Melipona bicolor]